MGKNRKKNTESKTQTTYKKISNQLRSKTNPLVQKLLDICTTTNVSPKHELEEYGKIFSILQEIRELEKEYVIEFPVRENHWSAFQSWCLDNGSTTASIRMNQVNTGNFGVFAQDGLKENDMFLSVPRKIMLSVENAKESPLGPLIVEDPILSAMQNVVLSIYLIMEYLKTDSFWKPYLSILPSSYDTILYFNMEELKLLQRSPCQSQMINICRSVARQYAYFHQLFQNNAYAMKLDIAQYFTYDLYRWAVSTVMTRQNAVPTADGESLITTLVPLWDMCNHANGKFSTDFNIQKDCVEAYAKKDFGKDEEVTIFYGKRSNSEYFIHNGFVYPDNENDWIPLQLNISKSDPLVFEKTKLCIKKGVILTGLFQLNKENIVSEDLLTFLKINILKEDEIKSIQEKEEILDSYLADNTDIRLRALSFLKDRATLLLKCYGSTLEEDEILLTSETDNRRRMAIQLRLCEKQLLNQCIKYCISI